MYIIGIKAHISHLSPGLCQVVCRLTSIKPAHSDEAETLNTAHMCYAVLLNALIPAE